METTTRSGYQDVPISTFKAILEKSLDGIVILKAIRNDIHEIIDFEYVFTIQVGLAILDQDDLLGKRLLEVFPEHLENDLFARYVTVVTTQTPETIEVFYGAPYHEWVQIFAIPVNDGISISFKIITEQKKEDKQIKRLRAFIENLPVGAAHRLGDTLIINEKVEEILGYSQEEITDIDTWFKLVHRHQYELGRGIYEEARANNFEGVGDVPFWTKSGQLLWIRMSAQVYDAGEVWVMQDITEQKQAQLAREKSENTLAAIIQGAIDGIITTDERGSIISINPAACALFDYSPEELVGKNVKILMSQPDHSKHDDHLKNYLATGEKKIIGIGREVIGRKKDGSTFPFELSINEIQVENKKLFSGFIHDLTELKKTVAINADISKIVEESLNEIYFFDANSLKFVQVNKGGRLNLGYSLEELYQITPIDIKPEHTEESFTKLIQPLLSQEKEKLVFETVHLRKDQTTYPVEVHLQYRPLAE